MGFGLGKIVKKTVNKFVGTKRRIFFTVLGGPILGTAVGNLIDYREDKNAQKEYKKEQEKIRFEEEQELRKRRNLLNKAIGTYKARASASGLDTDSGSSKAIMDSIMKDYDEDESYIRTRTDMYLSDLSRKKNLLNSKFSLSDGISLATDIVSGGTSGSVTSKIY